VVAVNETRVSATELSEDDAARVEGLRLPDGGREDPAEVPARPEAVARSSGWTGARITAVVIGGLLVLLSLVLLGAGGTALWADRTQREGGYVTSDVHEFSTAGSALATISTELGSAGFGWLYSPDLLDEVRIRVTPVSSGPPLFVGIGRSTDVDRYLAGVNHTIITEFWGDKTDTVEGGAPPSTPGTQDFWVASATGSGPQTVVWDPADGSWTVVVMNADGRPGIAMGADLGARMPAVLWIAIGLLAAGAVFLAGGALLIAGAIPRNRTPATNRNGGVMSTPSITVPAPYAVARAEEEGNVDRYQAVKQYSLAQIFAVWAAAALPMGVLSWIVAPPLADGLSGAGDVPMLKALLLVITAGLIWQFVLVLALVWFEQRSLRWSTLREALWLRSPRSPRSGRVGGKLWLIVIPLIVLFTVEEFLPAISPPHGRDLAAFLDTDAGQSFMSGNWGWFGLILVMFIFNTVLGEELLFRGLLLPRMNRVFGRGDWAANGVLFAGYHLHVPWMMPATVLIDTFAICYPSKRYQSAWIGIAVHSAQSVFFAAILLALVL
jgi:CAAX protease family protein